LTEETQQLGGLKPLSPDNRDLRYGAIHPAVDLKEIEGIDFDVFEPLRIKDQGPTDKCGGYGSTYMLEAHEGVEMNPDWQFAKIKQIEGDPNSWGADLRSIFKAMTKFGGLEEEKAQIYLNGFKGIVIDLRDYKNWAPELDDEAAAHKQQSYFFIYRDSYRDFFDALRALFGSIKTRKTSSEPELSGGRTGPIRKSSTKLTAPASVISSYSKASGILTASRILWV
jgi:hypothetical protein